MDQVNFVRELVEDVCTKQAEDLVVTSNANLFIETVDEEAFRVVYEKRNILFISQIGFINGSYRILCKYFAVGEDKEVKEGPQVVRSFSSPNILSDFFRYELQKAAYGIQKESLELSLGVK